MRLSTSLIYSQQMANINKTQTAWLAAGERVSTGKLINKPSDGPIAASQAVILGHTQNRDEQYSLAQTFAQQSLDNEESVLSNVCDNLHNAIAKVIYGATGTLNDNDRQSIAIQLQGIRDEILNLANSQDSSGRYIFAGYKTDSAPFVSSDAGIQYQGGDQGITQQVATQRTMTVNHTGQAIFMSLTSNATPEPDGSVSQSSVFDMLDSAIAALQVPLQDTDEATRQQFSDAMSKANRSLNNSLNNILNVRSEIGSQLSELDQLGDLGKDRELILTTQASQLTDVDVTQAISEYQMKQTALQASYTVYTQMSKLSLFQINS